MEILIGIFLIGIFLFFSFNNKKRIKQILELEKEFNDLSTQIKTNEYLKSLANRKEIIILFECFYDMIPKNYILERMIAKSQLNSIKENLNSADFKEKVVESISEVLKIIEFIVDK